MAVMMTGAKEDLLRIPVSEAYLAGRAAYEAGRDYYANPYRLLLDRLDHSIGWADAAETEGASK